MISVYTTSCNNIKFWLVSSISFECQCCLFYCRFTSGFVKLFATSCILFGLFEISLDCAFSCCFFDLAPLTKSSAVLPIRNGKGLGVIILVCFPYLLTFWSVKEGNLPLCNFSKREILRDDFFHIKI